MVRQAPHITTIVQDAVFIQQQKNYF